MVQKAMVREAMAQKIVHRKIVLTKLPRAKRLRDRPSGGARRDRTDDLLLAKQALSQLSYGPLREQVSAGRH